MALLFLGYGGLAQIDFLFDAHDFLACLLYTSILLKEGEPAVVAGMITKSDEKSLAGLPLFSKIPGLGVLASQQSKQEEDDELLILITPQVVRSPERSETPEIWISK